MRDNTVRQGNAHKLSSLSREETAEFATNDYLTAMYHVYRLFPSLLLCHLWNKYITLKFIVLLHPRCRHGAIAAYFGDDKPECNKSCDYCTDNRKADSDLDHLKRGAYGKASAKKHATTMIVEESDIPDQDLYGGGRKGVKRWAKKIVCWLKSIVAKAGIKLQFKLKLFRFVSISAHRPRFEIVSFLHCLFATWFLSQNLDLVFTNFPRDYDNMADGEDEDDDGAGRLRREQQDAKEKRSRHNFIMKEFNKRKKVD